MRQEHHKRLNLEKHAALPVGQSKLFILLDGARVDAPKLIYTHDDSPLLERLYHGTRHAEVIEASPCLIEPSTSSRLWSAQSEWQDFAVVLQSNASIDLLAGHLRSLISMRLPSQQLTYCRFYSPVWLQRFMASTTNDEFAALSGPVQRWYFHGTESWQSISSTEPGLLRTASEEGWFVLRQEQFDQWQTEEQALFIERMAVHLNSPPSNTLEGATERRRIASLTERASQLGLVQEYQATHYIELAWQFPVAIDSPELQALFDNQNESADQRLEEVERRLFGLQAQSEEA